MHNITFLGVLFYDEAANFYAHNINSPRRQKQELTVFDAYFS